MQGGSHVGPLPASMGAGRPTGVGPVVEIKTVAEFLSDYHLSIPDYQRPYAWTSRHVGDLLADILANKDKAAYRLGTVVLHEETKGSQIYHHIVDGQQRTVTLVLIMHAIAECLPKWDLAADIKSTIETLAAMPFMERWTFPSALSEQHISDNFRDIHQRFVRGDLQPQEIRFLLHGCQLAVFTLADIAEAFQFFDSQNARGKVLKPHDLLKAYHLREFGPGTDALKLKAISDWESRDTEELAGLFANYLYRIRSWVNGRPARDFTVADIGGFKGINIESEHYPLTGVLRIVDHFVASNNRQRERTAGGQSQSFPFQLDQIIVSGYRFFEMVTHYLGMLREMRLDDMAVGDDTHVTMISDKYSLSAQATAILRGIDAYQERWRTGDRYVRIMFDCLLLYYRDKFGEADLSRAIEKIFVWSYGLRLGKKAVRRSSMDKHVLKGPNPFHILREAARPREFTEASLEIAQKTGLAPETISRLFREVTGHV